MSQVGNVELTVSLAQTSIPLTARKSVHSNLCTPNLITLYIVLFMAISSTNATIIER